MEDVSRKVEKGSPWSFQVSARVSQRPMENERQDHRMQQLVEPSKIVFLHDEQPLTCPICRDSALKRVNEQHVSISNLQAYVGAPMLYRCMQRHLFAVFDLAVRQ